MNLDNNPVASETVARANVYHFLSAVYRAPPSQEFLRNIASTGLLEQLGPMLTGQWISERKPLTVAADFEKQHSTLKQEYMDLFAVPTGRYVTPFEDVYRGIRPDGKQERDPLLGDRAVATKVFYREAGAQMSQACKELPTHIGVELSFMAFLCEREAAEMGARIEVDPSWEQQPVAPGARDPSHFQLRFLREHLNDWFPQLNLAVQAKARSPFYRCLSQLTEDFLASDMEALTSQWESRGAIQERENATQPGIG